MLHLYHALSLACFALLVPHCATFSINKLATTQKSFQLTCNANGFGNGKIDLTAAVQQYLRKDPSGYSPFIKDFNLGEKDGTVHICENVEFTTDLVKGRGGEEYKAMAQSWSEACATELSEASSFVTRVAMVRQNVVSIQWNVTYVPDALISLVWIGRRIPGAKLSFYNVLDKERVRSAFSWVSFRAFLERIIYKGVVLLPHAVILGTTELSFREEDDSKVPDIFANSVVMNKADENLPFNLGVESPLPPEAQRKQKRWILTGSKEKINLVRSIDAGLLKNRKLATDLLQFLDARKPATVSLAGWNDVLVDRINTRSVPGMGQFDIDGLEAEQQKELLSVSNKILGWTTLVILLFGVAFSTVVFDQIFLSM